MMKSTQNSGLSLKEERTRREQESVINIQYKELNN